jgi:hypothetical protein
MHIMRPLLFIIVICFSISQSSIGQDRNLLKGVSEFREIVLRNYSLNIMQLEAVRSKLDSLGVDESEFKRFCFQLRYIFRNIYNEEQKNRKAYMRLVRESRIYQSLNDSEIAIIIENFELMSIAPTGIWSERYPHKIDANSLRLKEVSQYGIKKGDHILHFSASRNHLCEILYLSFDSIDITHHPAEYSSREKELFQVVFDGGRRESSKLNYPMSSLSRLDTDQKYDKIVVNAFGVLLYADRSRFKYQLSQIFKMLKEEGELILSANNFNPTYEGPVEDITFIEREINRMLKYGFKLKEKLISENEYLVYKLIKDPYHD